MAVRLKDIAEELGVSVVTVSKVLHNHPDISPATRERVLQKVKERNYQPNWVARSLVTRKTYMIGLIVPDLMHSFFSEVAKGVYKEILPKGYNALISNSQEDPELEKRHIEVMLARQVEGLIVASAQPVNQTGLFDILESQKIPYVLIDRYFPGLSANYVGVDDDALGYQATEYLISKGRRRIAHLRGPEISTGLGRLEGYRRALRDFNIDVPDSFVRFVKGNYQAGIENFQALMENEPKPDAIFCWNDPVAAGVIKAARQAGLRVPEDLAVVGAGNVHYSELLLVPLTTMDQGSATIGERSAEMLMKSIESKRSKPPRQLVLPPRLIVRESA